MKLWGIRATAVTVALVGIAGGVASAQDKIGTDRPSIGTGASVVPVKEVQLEFGFQHDRQKQETTELETWNLPTLFRYGFTPSLEGRVSTPIYGRNTLETASSSDTRNGMAPVDVGAKYQLSAFSDAEFGPTLGILGSVGFPSGSEHLKREDFEWQLALLLDLAMNETFALNVNVGGSSTKNASSDYKFAGAFSTMLSIAIPEDFALFVEFAWQEPDSRNYVTLFDAGFTWHVTPNFQVDIFGGTGFDDPITPDFFGGAGFSIR